MRKITIITLFNCSVALLLFFSAGSVWADFVPDDYGIQRANSDKVPQINSSGKIQNSYTTDSFFPLGMYFADTGRFGRNTIPELEDAGFNVVWLAWQFPTDNEFAELNRNGMKVYPHLQLIIKNQGSNAMIDMVKKYKDNPAVLAWYLTDETLWQVHDTAGWIEEFNRIKAVDPNRGIMIEGNGACGPASGAFDISNYYVYPIRNELDSLFSLASNVDTNFANGCPRPIFLIPQSFRSRMFGDDWPYRPSPAQLRGQMYTAIVHGVTGLMFFVQHTPAVWGSNTPWNQDTSLPQMGGINPQATPLEWAEVSKVNHEIETNKRILLAKTSLDQYHVAIQRGTRTCVNRNPGWCQRDDTLEVDCRYKYDRNQCLNTLGCNWPISFCADLTAHPLHTMLKDTGEGDTRYLLAVNIEGSPLEGRFSFTKNYASVTSVFDNRNIAISNNTFTDSFDGYGVHLYKLNTQAVSNPIPNCSNLTGPTILTVGQAGTYTADHSSPQGSLRGTIDVGQNGQILASSMPRITPSGNSGSSSFTWTPTTAGTYDVFCRAWNNGIAECRGQPSYVDGPPRYPCNGPNSSLTVRVLAPLPGDLNHDGHVDILDLRQLLGSFTNIFDYNLVVGNYGK